MLSLQSAKRRIEGAARRLTGLGKSTEIESVTTPRPVTARRYLSDQPARTEAFLQAARDYVSNRNEGEQAWLYRKPYDLAPGNPGFFMEMYQVMNLLGAMDIAPGGRVLEVGSGPGWVSEILMSLGFDVDGIEPCQDMIEIAQYRVDKAREHWKLEHPPRVEFHCRTMEDCGFEDGVFDAILFHAALHHVIDEEQGLAQCYRVLKPGGVLGVSEAAWRPGNRGLEDALEAEMRRFGTLENPYTQEYLEELLARHGFDSIVRYHAVNGWFPAHMGEISLERAAESPAGDSNNLTARKQGGEGPTTVDHRLPTSAEITVLESRFDAATRVLSAKIRLSNTGETRWLSGPRKGGAVTLALRCGEIASAEFQEASPRHPLPRAVAPGEDLVVDVAAELPEHWRRAAWQFDLVNEGMFWFSSRGTQPATLDL